MAPRASRGRRAVATRFVLALCAALAVGVPPARAQASPADEALAAELNRRLMLSASVLFDLTVQGQPGEPIRAQVPLNGSLFTLELFPHSNRSDEHYQVLVQGADGELRAVEPSPVRTLRGSVEGVPGSDVAATYDERGLLARIRVADLGEEFWVEPAADHVDGAPAGLHVVYRDADASSPGGFCGADAAPGSDVTIPWGLGLGSPCVTGMCVAELGCDADFQYYQDFGSSVSSVENRINSIVNTMNLQYESDVQLTHDITTIVVRTAEPDPYSADSIGGLLNNVKNQWEGPLGGIPHDITQLFTGRELSGGIIGIAWLGTVCSNQRYSVVENFTSGLSCSTDLSAHELGHNWNASHCTCSSFTMNPSITCANNFSSDSIGVINAFSNGVNCLDGSGPPQAGVVALPQSGEFPLEVQFFDSSSGTVSGWAWNFGDGGTSTFENPTHTYGAVGSYSVSLTVSGSQGSDNITLPNYIEVTPEVFDFANLGGATTGIIGQPFLQAFGQLLPGTPLDVLLQLGAPSAPSLVWLSFSSTPVPAFDGTVFANPPAAKLTFTLSPFGHLEVTTNWPSGVPSGSQLYIQFFIQDLSVPGGVTLSNAITATVP